MPLTGDIYTRTSRCLVWMGELGPGVHVADADAAAAALALLKRMATYEDPPRQVASVRAASRPMAALAAILPGRNPWWDRTWTLQEVVLPTLGGQRCCGAPLSMDWDHVYGVHGVVCQGIPEAVAVRRRSTTASLSEVYARGEVTVGLIRYDDSLRPIALDHHPSTDSWLPGWAHNLGQRWTLDVEIRPGRRRQTSVASICLRDMAASTPRAAPSISDLEFDAESKELTVGDEVWILKGANVPFITRPNGKTSHFIGSAFVDGLMFGEGVQKDPWQGKITLV